MPETPRSSRACIPLRNQLPAHRLIVAIFVFGAASRPLVLLIATRIIGVPLIAGHLLRDHQSRARNRRFAFVRGDHGGRASCCRTDDA